MTDSWEPEMFRANEVLEIQFYCRIDINDLRDSNFLNFIRDSNIG